MWGDANRSTANVRPKGQVWTEGPAHDACEPSQDEQPLGLRAGRLALLAWLAWAAQRPLDRLVASCLRLTDWLPAGRLAARGQASADRLEVAWPHLQAGESGDHL